LHWYESPAGSCAGCSDGLCGNACGSDFTAARLGADGGDPQPLRIAARDSLQEPLTGFYSRAERTKGSHSDPKRHEQALDGHDACIGVLGLSPEVDGGWWSPQGGMA